MIPNDPRLTDTAFLALAAWRIQAKRRAGGRLAPGWEESEGLCALLEAAKAAERHDDTPTLHAPGRGASGDLARLLAEARRYGEERDCGSV